MAQGNGRSGTFSQELEGRFAEVNANLQTVVKTVQDLSVVVQDLSAVVQDLSAVTVATQQSFAGLQVDLENFIQFSNERYADHEHRIQALESKR